MSAAAEVLGSAEEITRLVRGRVVDELLAGRYHEPHGGLVGVRGGEVAGVPVMDKEYRGAPTAPGRVFRRTVAKRRRAFFILDSSYGQAY